MRRFLNRAPFGRIQGDGTRYDQDAEQIVLNRASLNSRVPALVFGIFIALTSMALASSVTRAAPADPDDELNQPLVNEELSTELGELKPSDSVEAPPPPEYPYPGASEEGYGGSKSPMPRPSQAKASGEDDPSAGFDASPAPTSRDGTSSDRAQVHRPSKINPDGSYSYGTDLKNVPAHPAPGVEAPIKTDAQGQYFYKDSDPNPESGKTQDLEKPVSVTSKGEYVYKVRRTKAKTTASVRFGVLSPPDLHNSVQPNISYQDIYGSSKLPLVLGDYEWRLANKVGRLGINFTSGFATASGSGEFASTAEGRPSLQALEKLTFVVFPNQLTAIYKFQYADDQFFVPYIEGGAGYFALAELRDDNKSPKFGGSPVLVAAAGGSILMDWLDKRAIHQLDADYGVSHVWLTAEYRQFLGLSKSLDFTSNTYNVGFSMEF